MAPKDHCDPEEGIIELFDIVDAPEKTPGAPDDAASEDDSPEPPAPDQPRQPDDPDGESGQPLSRYPFENGPDFLDELDKTPNLTFLPPRTEAAAPEGDGSEEGRDEEGRGVPAEPDEDVIRAFEAEMAKAGGAVCEASPGDGDAAATETPDMVDERMDGIAEAVSDAPPAAPESPGAGPEAEAGAADQPLPPPDAEPHAGETDGEEAAAPLWPLPPFPPFLPSTKEAVPVGEKGDPALSGVVEERITRLEEALSRLSERVAALEQRMDEAGTETFGEALSEEIAILSQEQDALNGEMRALSTAGEAAQEEPGDPLPPGLSPAREKAVDSAPFSVVDEAGAFDDEGPDLQGLALESLQERVALLERRPVLTPDVAGIAQDVLALVRVDMEKAAEEQEAARQAVEDLYRRVRELEKRPLPQLILPELPDAEAIAADVMSRIRADLDRLTAETAARVLREEIARLMGK